MARKKVDREIKKAILKARKSIQSVAKKNGNEAETRRRVEDIFESVIGYDHEKNLDREKAVRGRADTEEHCDFVIKLDRKGKKKPFMIVEIKRAAMNLTKKHIKQVLEYTEGEGYNWMLLTNGQEWQLHHVSYGRKVSCNLVESWNLLSDNLAELADKFEMISYKNVRKGGLDNIWKKTTALTPKKVLDVLLSEGSLQMIRRNLRKRSGVKVSSPDVFEAIKALLNENSLNEIENLKFSLTESKKRHTRKVKQVNQETMKVESQSKAAAKPAVVSNVTPTNSAL